MPRLALLLTMAFCGLLAPTAQSQAPSRLNVFEGSASSRMPAPPKQIADDVSTFSPAESQAISNREMTVRPETKPVSRELPAMLPADEELLVDREHDFSPSRSAIPLPVPPPPPKLDPSIALVSHEESVSASASDRPAESKDKITLSPQIRKKLPLSSNSKSGESDSTRPTGELPSMVSVVGATGLVLGIFLLLAWIVRRKTPQAMHRLPGEAFEILGRAPLSGRQQVHLLRCGARLLLVSVTPAGAETLTEITDPAEVDRLAGLCRQAQPGSSSAAFKQIFEQLAPKRPGKGESMFHDEAERELSAAGYYRGRAWEDRHA